MAETPLEKVPGWSRDQVSRMKDSWITSAEQVVALGATSSGFRSLREQLGASHEEAKELVDAARAQLSPEALAEMEQVVDTSDYGLGVIHPWEENPET